MKSKQSTLLGGTVEQHENGRKLFEALADLFFRPIIGHVGWESSITPEQKQRITIERMKQLKTAKSKVMEATDYEALVYLMTASLSVPLSREAFHIYAYLFRKFYPEQAKEVLGESEGLKLDPYIEEPELKRLKQWIFKKASK